MLETFSLGGIVLQEGIFAAVGGVFLIMFLVFTVIPLAGMWKAFEKAGKPGWAAIVPVYNIIVLLEIVGRPLVWIVGLFIPVINFVVGILVSIDLAKSFGKGAGYGIGIILLPFIFIPLLGFGDAQYIGPAQGGQGQGQHRGSQGGPGPGPGQGPGQGGQGQGQRQGGQGQGQRQGGQGQGQRQGGQGQGQRQGGQGQGQRQSGQGQGQRRSGQQTNADPRRDDMK